VSLARVHATMPHRADEDTDEAVAAAAHVIPLVDWPCCAGSKCNDRALLLARARVRARAFSSMHACRRAAVLTCCSLICPNAYLGAQSLSILVLLVAVVLVGLALLSALAFKPPRHSRL
jgi:hypothetical protein